MGGATCTAPVHSTEALKSMDWGSDTRATLDAGCGTLEGFSHRPAREEGVGEKRKSGCLAVLVASPI